QAEEISRMNILLENDNITLKTNIEKVTDARVNATELDFDEFSLKYPDRDTCYKFLAELKWENGYACIKCGNTSYCNGKVPFNRRCTKCAYEESVLHQTIFENNRIPINKAFYLVYLMYNHKGAISSHKLSEKLGIRQSTCWTYASKIKKVMEERKKDLKGVGKSGWRKLVLDK
ncbi:MAG: chromosome partitioning protein ParA, partial [Pedobacter sp.]